MAASSRIGPPEMTFYQVAERPSIALRWLNLCRPIVSFVFVFDPMSSYPQLRVNSGNMNFEKWS